MMEKIMVKDGWLLFVENFIPPEEQTMLMQLFLRELNWTGGQITLFGKCYDIPRLQAYYADEACHYGYSGKMLNRNDWTPELLAIRERLNNLLDAQLNACLLNLYRNGRDSNGWHADNEKELGDQPLIASISLGVTRRFDLKHNITGERKSIPLHSGSLLVMGGAMQHYWKHQIPKELKVQEPRINLTFRSVLSS
jgi:alkylated DNA repair dioxygenase AlkB